MVLNVMKVARVRASSRSKHKHLFDRLCSVLGKCTYASLEGASKHSISKESVAASDQD